MNRQAGASLIELIISIMIISVGALGVMSVMATSGKHSADPMVRHQAVAIAEAYMEEILARSFSDPAAAQVCGTNGVDSGESSRQDYDDVDDYHGIANNGCSVPGGGACDQFGNTITGLEAYSISVAVACQALGSVPATHAKRITVTVSHPVAGDLPVSAWRVSLAP